MPNLIATETWEGGAAAAAVTTSNSHFTVTSNWTFTATTVAPGTGQSGHFNVTASNGASKLPFTGGATAVAHVVIPLRAVVAPSADWVLCAALAGGVRQADLQITTDLRVRLRNSSAGQIALSAANLIEFGSTSAADGRIEWTVDSTADTQQVRVFLNPTSSTADYDSGVVATTAMNAPDAINLATTAVTMEAYVGDVSVYSDGYPTFTVSAVAVRGSAQATMVGTPTAVSVTIPSAAQVGDLALLRFIGGDNTWTDTGPTGWGSPITSQGSAGITLKVWAKTIAAGDPGSTVTVTSTNTSGYKRILTVAVYSGGILGAVQSAIESTARTSHTTPAVTAVAPTAWVMSGCADRASPGSQAWTLPPALTLLQQAFGSGGGAPSAVLATDDAVGSGTVGVYTITGTVSTTAAVMWSVVIEPAGTSVGNSANAGVDVYVEPRVAFTRTATATGTPTGWAWTQLANGAPTLTLSGASTATVSVTPPPNIALQVYQLQVSASYASGSPAVDVFNLVVYPVTKRFVGVGGLEVPLAVYKVT